MSFTFSSAPPVEKLVGGDPNLLVDSVIKCVKLDLMREYPGIFTSSALG